MTKTKSAVEEQMPDLSTFRYTDRLPEGFFTRGLVSAQSKPFQSALFRARQYSVAEYPESARQYFRLELDDEGNITGSDTFDVALVDRLVRPSGARTILPRQVDGEIFSLIENRFYIDPKALILRGTRESYEKNIPLANHLTDLVGEHGITNLSTPVLITGYDIAPWPEDEKGYGIKIVPIEGEFEVIQSDKLTTRYNEWRFNSFGVDNLPGHLDKNNGRFTWLTSDRRLCRFFVYWDGVACADDEYLDCSGEFGRVVVVSGEAGTPTLLTLDKTIDAQVRSELLEELERDIQNRNSETERLQALCEKLKR